MESNARLKQDSESRNGRGSERNNQHFFCFESLQISDRLSEHRTVLLHFSLELPSCLDTIYETERYTPTLVAPPHTHTSARHQSPALCPCRWPYPCGPGHPPPVSHSLITHKHHKTLHKPHSFTNKQTFPSSPLTRALLYVYAVVHGSGAPGHPTTTPLLSSLSHTHTHILSLSPSLTHIRTQSQPPLQY